jgi:hypothetical protein
VKRVLRILCALAVFISSTAYCLAFYHAAFPHRVTVGYVISALIFALVGVLSFVAIYFILGLSKA